MIGRHVEGSKSKQGGWAVAGQLQKRKASCGSKYIDVKHHYRSSSPKKRREKEESWEKKILTTLAFVMRFFFFQLLSFVHKHISLGKGRRVEREKEKEKERGDGQNPKKHLSRIWYVIS